MVASGPCGRRTDERARLCHPYPGADEAVWGARRGPRHRPRRASRRDLRADRAGRRGEDLDVPDPRRRDGGDVRRRRAARSAGATGAGVRRLPHAGVQPLPGPERGGEPPLRRRAAARAGARDRAARESLSQDVRDGALHRAARGTAQRRHEAEAGARLRARGRAPHSPARRADDGRRSGLSPRVLGRARAALEPGHDDSPGDAVESVRAASPTLENTFVAILRGLEGETRVPPFPDRRDHARADEPIAIGARGLRKTFGEFVAVKGIDLEVRYGEVYGLLGANGAGKTTTIKMVCGLVEPGEGEGRLAGEGGALRSEGVRQQVGYMSQKFSLYDDLPIDENRVFLA